MKYTDEDRSGLLVAENPCEHCLFGKSPVVRKGRKGQIIKDCLKRDTHFLCHVPQVTGDSTEVVCRGFYERYPTQMIRIAQRLNMVFFVDVE